MALIYISSRGCEYDPCTRHSRHVKSVSLVRNRSRLFTLRPSSSGGSLQRKNALSQAICKRRNYPEAVRNNHRFLIRRADDSILTSTCLSGTRTDKFHETNSATHAIPGRSINPLHFRRQIFPVTFAALNLNARAKINLQTEC